MFAYGSLMWNPCFAAAECVPAVLENHCRRFSLWSMHARGTPETPGLGLALERRKGARCEGLLFALPAGAGAAELEPLWEREMWTLAYDPEWLRVRAGGAEVAALAFVAAPDHPKYAGVMPVAEAARHIAFAAGKFGTCRAYLADAVAALRARGLRDRHLEALAAAVARLRA